VAAPAVTGHRILTDDLCQYSSAQLRQLYLKRIASPIDVASAILDRIDHLNPRFNIFSYIDPETTIEMARRSEARWQRGRPLGPGDGIPATIKDNMHVIGWPRRCGSLTIPETSKSSFDSACVARLREAGCVFLGKTTTPEFAWKGVTDSPLLGMTRNPWNPALTPGGSSGGAAVAAALGMGAWHLASDAAGSIRIPAAFCGVQGFKPTFGIVPNFPASPFSGLGHHGPLARDVSDLAAIMTVISRPDRRDATACPPGTIDFSVPLEDGLRGKMIGYVKGGFGTDPDIVELIDKALIEFERLGARIEEIELELSDARDQIENYWSVGCALLMDSIPPNEQGLVDPGIAERARRGRDMTAAHFRASELDRESLASSLNLLHEHHDFIVTPAVPVQAFPTGHDVPPGSDYHNWIDWTPFTYPFNLTQQPAISVACGLTAKRLPAGLQIVGPRFSDLSVLRAAQTFETACPPARLQDVNLGWPEHQARP
jgi:aspartyl-tRNA(Asn)/glutamyl-tRNA(Gln) amidotransferase subunit A